MAPRNPDPDAPRFQRNRHEHGGAPQRLDDDQLAQLAEEERVDAGLDDFDPDEVPPATDTPPVTADIRETEAYQEEHAELRRQIDQGELRDPSDRNPFPPTRYED